MIDRNIRKIDLQSKDIPDDAYKWKLDTNAGTESQTFYFRTDSNHFLLVQIAYSTMGWSPSAQTSVRIYCPDGNHKLISKNVGASDLVFSADKTSIKSPTLAYQLESRKPIRYNISFSGSDLVFDMSFEAIAGGCQVNDGKTPFNLNDASYGYVSNWFVPKGKVVGFMTLNGENIDVQGSGSFVYAAQSKPQSVARWNFVDFQSKSDALILYQFEIPEYSKNTGEICSIDSWSFGCLVHNNQIESITFENYSIFEDLGMDAFSGYNIPKKITHVWNGTTLSGKTISVTMPLSLSNLLSKCDVLAELPYLIRVFLQTFITAPFLYQWTEPINICVEIDSEKFEISGNAFSETAFMLELPIAKVPSVKIYKAETLSYSSPGTKTAKFLRAKKRNRKMTASLEKTKVDPMEVGWLFVQEYYTFLNKDPSRLHCFYNKKSTLLHGHEGENAVSSFGQSDIHKRILDFGFNDCKVLVSNVDSQASAHGGIIVQVLGEMSNKGSASQKFAQTFFLAEQPNGYYVLNDIFRYLKEDLEDEFEEAEVPVVGLAASIASNGHSMMMNEKVINHAPPPVLPPKSVDKPKMEVKKAPEQLSQDSKPEVRPKSPVKNAKEAWSKPKPKVEEVEDVVENQQVEVLKKEEKFSKQSSTESTKPKTWAIAAGTLPSPVVSTPVAVAVAAPKPPTAPAPQKLQINKSQEVSPPEKSTAKSQPSPQSQQSNGFHQVNNRRYENRRPSDQQGTTDDREKYSIYIKGLQEGVDRKSMVDIFEKYGQIVKCDIIPTRNIAFIEFTTTEAASKVIGTQVIVNGVTLAVEERKRVQYINYYNKKQSFSNNNQNGNYTTQNGKGSDSKQPHRSGSRHRSKKHSNPSPATNGNGKTIQDLSNKA